MNSWRMPACLFAFGDGPRAPAEIYLTGAEAGACAPPSASVEDFAAKSVRPCHMVSGVRYRYSEGFSGAGCVKAVVGRRQLHG